MWSEMFTLTLLPTMQILNVCNFDVMLIKFRLELKMYVFFNRLKVQFVTKIPAPVFRNV